MTNESLDGSIKVLDGKIIVKNPKGEGKPAAVYATGNVKVIIDGIMLSGKSEIFEESTIEIVFDETEASRKLDIRLAEDLMEAYISVKYRPKNVFRLKDKQECTVIELECELINQIYPPKYKIEEILKELSNNKIVYGIIESNLEKCVESECTNIIIAKGQEVIDGVSDRIELKFAPENGGKKFVEDKTGNIDFKSIGSVQVVKVGEILAVKIPGTPGCDGHNVKGNIIKPKDIKQITIKAGKGCIIKDGDKVISLIDGKPCIRNNVFNVFEVHEIKSDVNLSTGDIKFIGDINILGGIAEGMQIICGNSVKVSKDVEGSIINAKGDVTVKGNVLRSKIYGGGQDVSRLAILKDLESLKLIVNSIVDAVCQIKEHNILGNDKKDGDLIKLLIESKYKNLTVICIKIISCIGTLYEEEKNGELSKAVRQKLLGLAPLSIRNYGELDLVIKPIDILILRIKSELSIPVSVSFGYCQDSVIKSSGDIMVKGKGVYISELVANDKIKFLMEKSVARGGSLRAVSELSCRIVGSSAGVPTRLQVDKEGSIFVDIAFQNTVFTVGHKEHILERPSRNIHAYLNPEGDIVVDKLLLEV